jgi:ribonuclease G
MSKELIINDSGFETRVALLEDGVLVELHVERRGEADIVGNVYKAKVLRVLPGMQAAFVDIGQKQAAFIYVDDVVAGFPYGEDGLPPPEEGPGEKTEPAPEDAAGSAVPSPPPARRPIEQLISEGQEILVLVTKSPIGNKGARVTSRISIPGRLLVFMPSTSHVGVSRRIEDLAERERLKEGLISRRQELYGYILRTVSEGVEIEKISQEMDFLSRLWKRIVKRSRQASAPSLLHRELSASLRAVRDLFTHEVDRLVIDSMSGYREIVDFVDSFLPTLKDAVQYYEGSEPVFEAYHLEGEISRLSKKKVWLKSGGYIVIEDTEALVAIDVNTGRYVGKGDLAETILKTNLEAVKEIAYQVRLRDIGGIIVLDFIDMERREDREKVFEVLKAALKRDRSTTNVLPMSEMGLIEMTRKRTRENLKKTLSEPCFYCDGEGAILSKKSICHNIYRQILRHSRDMAPGSGLSLKVHPEIAQFLLEEENLALLGIEDRIGAGILIREDPKLHVEGFEIEERACPDVRDGLEKNPC